ncbi:hypothetical protein R1sor_009787 [Riccia sorocarpa]|uniref:Uncharacterized protein n=1 Tax=Riccia sorocarpa TaxID=122646 RepID=A0ABD3I073_9MARC
MAQIGHAGPITWPDLRQDAFQHLEDTGGFGDKRRRWVCKVYSGTEALGKEDVEDCPRSWFDEREGEPAPAPQDESDSEEDREITWDIKASHKHEVERTVAAKSAKSLKDKGKSVAEEAPRKKPSVLTQAPKEKLLGSKIVVEKASLSRESKTDSGKRKRESYVTPPLPSKAPVEVTAETLMSEDKESGSSDKDRGDATDSGSDILPPSQPVNKKGAKLKTLKQMDKSNIDREKHDIRRRAVEQCHVSVVPIVILLEQLLEPTLEQDSSKWEPYHIRALSESFVDTLTTSMMTNTDNNYHSLIVVLQPRLCKKNMKEDWQEDYPSTWSFSQQIEYYHKHWLERRRANSRTSTELTIETQIIDLGHSVESKMLTT